MNSNRNKNKNNNNDSNVGEFLPKNITITNNTEYEAVDIFLEADDEGLYRFPNVEPQLTIVNTYCDGILISKVSARLRVRQPNGSYRLISALAYENYDLCSNFPDSFIIQEISTGYFAILED
ncbi:hypothetical protein Q0N88_20180 [Bacillus thuringiensis]|uniref:hypothetical protein n=1 Tax=Bacillus thuringiensis TaxID=1428 RepID=UPI00345A5A91